MFFRYSGGRGRSLSRGTPRGRRKASGGGRFGKRVKTRWIRGPGAPKRVKNAYERRTPHGSVGQTVLPTDSGVSPPGSRGAVSRGLKPSWPSPAGSVAGSAHKAVEAKFRPTALGGVRAARVLFRGSMLPHSSVFYRATRCGSGAQNPRFSQPIPSLPPPPGSSRHGCGSQTSTRVLYALGTSALRHFNTEIRAPRAQRSTRVAPPSPALSTTLLRNLGRLPEIDILDLITPVAT